MTRRRHRQRSAVRLAAAADGVVVGRVVGVGAFLAVVGLLLEALGPDGDGAQRSCTCVTNSNGGGKAMLRYAVKSPSYREDDAFIFGFVAMMRTRRGCPCD